MNDEDKKIAAELTKAWFNFAGLSTIANRDSQFGKHSEKPEDVYTTYKYYLEKLNSYE